MSQVGLSVAILESEVVIVYSTPEKGGEYQVVYDLPGFVDAMRTQLGACLGRPELMAAVLGYTVGG